MALHTSPSLRCAACMFYVHASGVTASPLSLITPPVCDWLGVNWLKAPRPCSHVIPLSGLPSPTFTLVIMWVIIFITVRHTATRKLNKLVCVSVPLSLSQKLELWWQSCLSNRVNSKQEHFLASTNSFITKCQLVWQENALFFYKYLSFFSPFFKKNVKMF